jgi:uncharacterized protein (TIRG00374 family)
LPEYDGSRKFGVTMDEYKPRINLRRMVLLVALVIVLMAITGWLLSRENFYEMLDAIRHANYLLITSAIAIYFVSMAIWTGRWQTALSFINCRIAFATRYLIICATVFLNNISPGARVGGDPFGRIYMLRKLENIGYSSGMASLIGEFALTPLLVVSFLMGGLLLQFGRASLQLSLILTAAWVLAALGTIFIPRLFFRRRIAARGMTNITSRVLGRFGKRTNIQETVEGIEAFYSSTYTIMDRWRKVLSIGGWTLLIGAFDIFRFYAIFLALGYHPTLSTLLVASSLPIIVGLIPLLPGGLVLVEGSLISILALFGVPLDVAMAATLIERGITFVLSTIVGAGIFSYLGVKIAARAEAQNQTRS